MWAGDKVIIVEPKKGIIRFELYFPHEHLLTVWDGSETLYENRYYLLIWVERVGYTPEEVVGVVRKGSRSGFGT